MYGQALWLPESKGYGRIFCSTALEPVQFKSSAIEADRLAPRPIRRGKRKGEPTIDTREVGWMLLMELAVLGCHEEDGDRPQGLVFAAYLLRRPRTVRRPWLLRCTHLAGLGQEYALPARGEGDGGEGADTAEPDPARYPAPDLEEELAARNPGRWRGRAAVALRGAVRHAVIRADQSVR